MTPPRRIAVIGSGIAGLTAAHVAARTAHVTLFEADDRLGGHADTHLVPTAQGETVAVDTGFLVHNERTYPTLRRLFAELGVETQESEMSMSVSDPATGLEWAGALGVRGLVPTLSTLRRGSHLRMLTEIPRFHRKAAAVLQRSPDSDDTLGEFVAAHGFSTRFVRDFLEPLVAAVWSCPPGRALDYPAVYLFTFLRHHGMLGVFGSPVWRTVRGGSREYVERVAAELDEVRTGQPVVGLSEDDHGVAVTTRTGESHRFDAAVVATHPDQALALLSEPSPVQRRVLGALPYLSHTALLHTDTSLLPRARRARASWNFRRRDDGRLLVTYDVTRLMRLPVDSSGRRFLVTLGGEDVVDSSHVIATRDYQHPVYTPSSVAARARLVWCDTDRVAFAGAWQGWGFHEDGALSGLRAATRLGLPWPEQPAMPPARPGLYRTTIRHTRRRPWRRTFSLRSHTWLVDLDRLPDHGIWGRFEARDHVGDPGRSIRENLDGLLASHGLQRPSRILMAAQPRALGCCFNPITVHWCLDAGDVLRSVVVEVHNTYGERHAYVLEPDERGRVETQKRLYVSPFHGTDGHYRVHVPLPRAAARERGRDRLDIGVELFPAESGDARFSASLEGLRVEDATRADVRRAALASWRGSLLIHAHGIWLWLRRLPIHPRPANPTGE